MSNQASSSPLNSQIQKLTEHKIQELLGKIQQLKDSIENLSTSIEKEEMYLLEAKKEITQNLTRSISNPSPSINFESLDEIDFSKIQVDIQNFLQSKYL